MVSASDRNSRTDQSSAPCLTSWAKHPSLCTAALRGLLEWPCGTGLSITGFASGFCEETTEEENTSSGLLKSRLITSQSGVQVAAHPIEKNGSNLCRRGLNSSTFSGRNWETLFAFSCSTQRCDTPAAGSGKLHSGSAISAAVVSAAACELLWRRKPPMSTLFPALCSKAFSSLRKHVRILPKCTLFFFSLHFPCQVEARSTLSQINGKYSLKGKGLKDGLDLREEEGRLLCLPFWLMHKLHGVASSITNISEILGGATKLTRCWLKSLLHTSLLLFICVNKLLRQSWAEIPIS